MSKKKPARKPKRFSEAIGIKYIFGNETSDFFMGLILLAISLFMVIAMVSYFYTGQVFSSPLYSTLLIDDANLMDFERMAKQNVMNFWPCPHNSPALVTGLASPP